METNNKFAKLFAALGLITVICGFAVKPSPASTPVRFKQLQKLIIVQVTVNEAGPFDFIFDTGSCSTVIDLELAKQLGLIPIASSSAVTVAGSKTLLNYRLDTLGLGPISVRNLTVFSTDLRDIRATSPKVRGVLGQNFLSRFDYMLNYRDQRIEFEENGEFANTLQGVRIPVERDSGMVLIATQPSSPQQQASKLVIDSGASSVVVFKDALRKSDLEIDLDVNGGITTSTIIGSQALSTGRLRKLQLGNEKFSGLPVSVVDNRAVAERGPETGLLPTSLFRSIYFNNTQNFVVLNPHFPK